MITSIRKRFTYANVAMTLALVFAMTGGAYAAKKFIITNTKQISPKVLKQLQGKVGPAGAQGPAGAKGKDGAAGLPGKDGSNGTNGKDGVSVTSSVLAKGSAACKEGGSEFTSASGKTTACNGEKGEPGEEGSPWTLGGTLPKGDQETGTWLAPANSSTEDHAALSFPIPLAAPGIAAANVAYVTTVDVKNKTLPTGCKGTAESPEAEEGYLCVFEGPLGEGALSEEEEPSVFTPGEFKAGAGPTGALLNIPVKAAESRFEGTWAVRAFK